MEWEHRGMIEGWQLWQSGLSGVEIQDVCVSLFFQGGPRPPLYPEHSTQACPLSASPRSHPPHFSPTPPSSTSSLFLIYGKKRYREGEGEGRGEGGGGRKPHTTLLVLAYHPIIFFVGHARIFRVMNPLFLFLGFVSEWTLAYSVLCCEPGVPWTFENSKEAPRALLGSSGFYHRQLTRIQLCAPSQTRPGADHHWQQ